MAEWQNLAFPSTKSSELGARNLFMLAEHVQSNFFFFFNLNSTSTSTSNTCFLKQPHWYTQNNRYTRKPGMHPPALSQARLARTGETRWEIICPRRAFLACLALHAPPPVALPDFFSILLKTGPRNLPRPSMST